MGSLDEIRQLIDAGAFGAARQALEVHLKVDPHHIAAWMLLAKVLEDPQRQADCYRQVLSLDPGHESAKRALAHLAASAEAAVLRCPQCGGAMEVYFAGEQHDKRARCPYCATEVDLPDSFQKVQRTQTSEDGPGGQRSSDTLVVESRSDGDAAPLNLEEIARLIQAQDHGTSDAPEGAPRSYGHTLTKDDLQRLFAEHGVAVTEEQRDAFGTGQRVSEREETGTGRRTIVRHVQTQRTLNKAFPDKMAPQGCLFFLLQLFGKGQMAVTSSRPTSPVVDVDAILKMARRPLSSDERCNCPHCGATISKQATQCAWCGAQLKGEG